MIPNPSTAKVSKEQPPRHLAENFTLQAFVNCYLREVASGHWIQASDSSLSDRLPAPLTGDDAVVIQLPADDLLFDVAYRSTVGRHTFTAVYQSHGPDTRYQRIPPYTAIITLIRSIYAEQAPQATHTTTEELELCSRLTDSLQWTTTYLENRIQDSGLTQNRYIEAEQSILFGHWLHPTPKSRQGISFWQHGQYTPELKGRFALHYFAVNRDYLEEDSALQTSAAHWIAEDAPRMLLQQCQATEVLLPQHPLQAQHLLNQPRVRKALQDGWLRDLGCHGAPWFPTSSVRTLYQPGNDKMYKFSIPVKITNSLRRNRKHELPVGVIMTRLMRRIDFFQRFTFFHIVDDPAYLNVRFPDQAADEESGFELILRKNVFAQPKGHAAVLIAALTQDPLQLCEGTQRSRLHTILQELSALEGRDIHHVAKDWFEQYWQCAIEPLLYLYDRHGIALEAHQQNSLLNLANGYPTDYFYRDNQGFYLAPAYRDELIAQEPGITELDDLFYDEPMIQRRFAYYLCINQLFSIIHRLGADGLCNEAELIRACRHWLESLESDLTGAGKRMIRYLLDSDQLAFKANLLTRIHDVDELEAEQELAVYAELRNPFKEFAPEAYPISADRKAPAHV